MNGFEDIVAEILVDSQRLSSPEEAASFVAHHLNATLSFDEPPVGLSTVILSLMQQSREDSDFDLADNDGPLVIQLLVRPGLLLR